MKVLTSGEFARRLKDAAEQQDSAYAFFLGAGCSRSSGIPTAGELVADNWLPRLKALVAPDASDAGWVVGEIPDWDPERPAASYGEVIERLFMTADTRQREIETLCDGKFPGFGYAVLAALMARSGGCFSVALTTNFDDLLADALYLFTPARPLVIHHEALAPFIRPTRSRPIVVKMHGDNRLAPMNTVAETEHIKRELHQHVPSLLHDRGLIIVGYGGNDDGIAALLKELPPEALPLGIYWVSKQEPGAPVRGWLERRNAAWVQEADFDETMLLLRDAFELAHPSEQRIRNVFSLYRETYQRLSGEIFSRPAGGEDTAELRAAVERADEATRGSWWRVALEAERQRVVDPDAADRTFAAGVEQFPGSSELLSAYAWFLARTRRDLDRAEDMYERAIVAAPDDVGILGDYAVFLADQRFEIERSETTFSRALMLGPDQVNNLLNYAAFFVENRRQFDRAEALYEHALEIDPNSTRTLTAFATLLRLRSEVDRAESLLKHAIAAEPHNARALSAYADLLAYDRDDPDEAEHLYERALGADLDSGEALVAYALFLKNVRENFDRAEECYKKALERDPDQAVVLTNYAGFLMTARGDLDHAEILYERAIATGFSAGFGEYAVFLAIARKDYKRALKMFDRAIEARPEDVAIAGNRGALLLGVGELAKGEAAVREVLSWSDVPPERQLGLAFDLYADGVLEARAESLGNIAKLLHDGTRCDGWDFSLNLAQAERAGDHDMRALAALAAVITGESKIDDLREFPEFCELGN